MWVEQNWDHKFIAYKHDPVMESVDRALFSIATDSDDANKACLSIVWVDFNPTAENLGHHLLDVVGPQVLLDTGVELVSVVVEETRKCSAEVSLGNNS